MGQVKAGSRSQPTSAGNGLAELRRVGDVGQQTGEDDDGQGHQQHQPEHRRQPWAAQRAPEPAEPVRTGWWMAFERAPQAGGKSGLVAHSRGPFRVVHRAALTARPGSRSPGPPISRTPVTVRPTCAASVAALSTPTDAQRNHGPTSRTGFQPHPAALDADGLGRRTRRHNVRRGPTTRRRGQECAAGHRRARHFRRPARPSANGRCRAAARIRRPAGPAHRRGRPVGSRSPTGRCPVRVSPAEPGAPPAVRAHTPARWSGRRTSGRRPRRMPHLRCRASRSGRSLRAGPANGGRAAVGPRRPRDESNIARRPAPDRKDAPAFHAPRIVLDQVARAHSDRWNYRVRQPFHRYPLRSSATPTLVKGCARRTQKDHIQAFGAETSGDGPSWILDRCRQPRTMTSTPTCAESPASRRARLVGPRTLPLMRALMPAAVRAARLRDVEVLTLGSGAGVRLYRPTGVTEPGPALLWIHGGGYVIGSAQQDDRLCRGFSRRLGITVASVEYRLAPEHPYPAPLEDCYSALTWLAGLPAVDRGAGRDRRRQRRRRPGGGAGPAGPRPRRGRTGVPAVGVPDARRPQFGDRRRSATTGCGIRAANQFGWTAYLGDADPQVAGPGTARRPQRTCRRPGSAWAPMTCSTTRTSPTPNACTTPGCRARSKRSRAPSTDSTWWLAESPSVPTVFRQPVRQPCVPPWPRRADAVTSRSRRARRR